MVYPVNISPIMGKSGPFSHLQKYLNQEQVESRKSSEESD